MRLHGWKVLAAALVATCCQAAPVQAQTGETDELRARVAELEQIVSRLQDGRMHYASHHGEGGEADHGACGGCCSNGGCDTCCSNDCCGGCEWIGPEFYTNRCRTCGIVAGAEFIYLRPYASEDLLTTGIGQAQLDFEPSMRYWLGWQLDSGLGARIRYWEIDRGEDFGGTSLGVEFRTLDLEATQNVDFRRWSLLVSGGIRYAESNIRRNTAETGQDGIGLTTSLTAARDLTEAGGLRFVTTARWSALYGNSKDFINGALVDVDRDDLFSILELSIGPQVRRQLSSGAFLTFNTGFEAQYWSNGIGADTQDVGFIGWASSVGIAR